MAISHKKNISSFTCNLTILQAKNIEPHPKADLFVRFYLSSGNSSCSLNTREIKSPSSSWNQTFSLECNGGEDSIITGHMQEASVVFELRQRIITRRPSVLRSLLSSPSKSKVLGRTEVSWRSIFEAPNMELEGWLDCEGVKAPSIWVAVKVLYEKMDGRRRRRRSQRLKRAAAQHDECGCRDCGDQHVYSCEDYYDGFAVAAALEAF